MTADDSLPLFQAKDSNLKVKFAHTSPTLRKHVFNYGHTDSATAHQGGGLKKFVDNVTMTSGAIHNDLAELRLPSYDCFVCAEFTVTMWRDDDPTKRGVWKCSQNLRQVSSAVTFEGSLNDDVAADDNGGHTHPTLENTSGVISVRVYEHATQTIRATVVCDYIVTVK